MKKILVFVVFACACLWGSVAVAADNATVGETAMRAVVGIESIAAKLDGVAPMVWDALLFKNRVDAWGGIVGTMVCLVLVIVAAALAFRWGNDQKREGLCFVAVSVAVALSLVTIGLLITLPTFIAVAARPEVGAIQDIVTMFGGK